MHRGPAWVCTLEARLNLHIRPTPRPLYTLQPYMYMYAAVKQSQYKYKSVRPEYYYYVVSLNKVYTALKRRNRGTGMPPYRHI